MKLNQEWQKQWDNISIPEKEIEKQIQQLCKPSKKNKLISFYKNNRKKKIIFALALVGILIIVIGIGTMVQPATHLQMTQSNDMNYKEEQNVSEQAKQNRAKEPEVKDRFDKKMAPARPDRTSEEKPQTKKADKLATSYAITKETEQFKKDSEAIQDLLSENQGYIENTNIQYDKTFPTAYFQLRIPQKEVNQFLAQLKKIGKTVDENVKSTNYLTEYSDNEGRLTALKAEETALLEILAKSGEISDILEIQTRLGNIRTEKEQLTSRNQLIDQQVTYTSVTIQLEMVEKEKTRKTKTIVQQIQHRYKQQKEFWQNIGTQVVVTSVSYLFYIVFIAIVIGAILYKYKKRKQKSV